jgi:hypothetical protein
MGEVILPDLIRIDAKVVRDYVKGKIDVFVLLFFQSFLVY